MPLQLSTVLRRLGRLVPGGHVPSGRPGPGPVAGAADPRQARAEHVLAGLAPRDRERYTALVGSLPATTDPRASVLARVLASSGSVAAVERLAEVWDGAPAGTRDALLDPVRHLAREGRQTSQTTCGSASLVMLAAAGDPLLALWLLDGRVAAEVSGARPGLLAVAPTAALAALADAPAEKRFAAAQRVVHARTSARGLGILPWPSAFGTPPWTAAREARFPGVTFTSRVVDDTDRGDTAGVLARVGAWVDRGVPVPLYAGGDAARGWATAMPRHVVLAIGRAPGGLAIWEPSVGKVLTLETSAVLAGTGASAKALGGWGHLCWAVLPVA